MTVMDKIIIRRLELNCVIGCNPEERLAPRKLLATITLLTDTRPAATSDNLKDTVNYATLSRRLRNYAATTSFLLIETLAEQLAAHCLNTPGVQGVTVVLDKPNCISQAEGAAVEITRP